MGKIKSCILVIFGLLVTIVVLGFVWNEFFANRNEENTSVNQEEENTSVNQENVVILKKLQEVLQLDLVKYEIEKVFGKRVENRFLNIPFGDKELILMCKADVTAYVDVSNLTSADVVVEDRTVKLTLPSPRIESRFLEQPTVLKKDDYESLEEWQQLENEVLQEIEEDAKRAGIIEEAKAQASYIVKNLVTLLGFEDVEITFVD
ncbi:MAG: DUF4230 domain-containing protein [Fervidobacterium sp.]|uniref:DUF4230 domain-containing protein n=1 Tax=Fervidobacterium gondwanense DSM 13020 TaxID=1121883 RepID=A0A1M7TF58_FERGO|nr:DUF4230 domain-containing protein [Fervidobacterium gondwanense]UXF01864.1 hypothetical protein IB67_10225 [Fervidobacterium riparium]SHN69345.1 Protein of unknown function [Fervidobacterium gondwanense DSM 13020]